MHATPTHPTAAATRNAPRPAMLAVAAALAIAMPAQARWSLRARDRALLEGVIGRALPANTASASGKRTASRSTSSGWQRLMRIWPAAASPKLRAIS